MVKIKYGVENGYAVVQDKAAVVVMALAAPFAPLVGAWCAEDSELGKVGELRGCSLGCRRFVQPEHDTESPS